MSSVALPSAKARRRRANYSIFAFVAKAVAGTGKAHGMQLFGARAVDAMRMEKGFLHWKADLLTEFDPFETGLDRFVKLEKGDFVGRDALIRRQAKGPSKRLITLEIATTDAPAHGGVSVMVDDKVVGTITSGEWGRRVGKNLAFAFVDLDVAEPKVMLEVDMCRMLVSATVIQASPYDLSHELMRR
jgi:dimethylglycine dehydrogenase